MTGLISLLRRARRSFWDRFGSGQPGNVEIHPEAKVDRRAIIETGKGGRIVIGKGTVIGPHAMLSAYGGEIVLGENCSVNPFCVLYGHGGLSIGDHVRIATHCVLVPANHVFDDRDKPIARQGLTTVGIRIFDDVWLGAGCRILDGVTIGHGAVVGAGSVVTKDIPSMTVFAGVPAAQIGTR